MIAAGAKNAGEGTRWGCVRAALAARSALRLFRMGEHRLGYQVAEVARRLREQYLPAPSPPPPKRKPAAPRGLFG